MSPLPLLALTVPINGTTLLVLLLLIGAGVWAFNHYRKRLLNFIPDSVVSLLNATGLMTFLSGGQASVPREMPVIVALDNAIQTFLELGMADDAAALHALRYKLQARVFAPIKQSASASTEIAALAAKAVAEQLQKQQSGGAV